MKKLILIVQFVASTLFCNAQAPNWLWGESETSGSCNMDVHGIWAGPSGNVYMGGRFGGTMTLNGASATASGTEVFSARLDSGGIFKWIAPHPYTGENDYDYGFGADKYENTYVTGQTQGSNGLFVDKYDSSGNKVWSFAPASLSTNMGGYGHIAVDNAKCVYVTGGYNGSENFGPVTLNAIGTGDLFLAKLDSSGTKCLWAVDAGASGQYVGGRGVAYDPQGYVYVCGSYNGTASFGSITLPTVNSDAFFIAKYDTSGSPTPVWVQTASNSGFHSGAYYWQFNDITVDSCSNIYVTGHFVNTAQFGPFTLTNANGNYDIFVAKCLSNGNWEWAQSAGGPGNDEGFGITLDKFSDVYVTGYFNGTANFDGQSVTTTAATSEVFVAKYANSNGDLQWVQTGGGSLSNDGIGISLDKQGHAYIVGDLSDGSGAIFGSSSINGIGGCNIFVAKLDTVAPRTITPTLLPSYCPGSTDTVEYSINGTFNSGNVFTVQISDSTGSFATWTDLGTDTSTAGGKIVITIPDTIPNGSTYLIRVVSSNPATSSWANGCGNYYVQNVYPNDFYITIGGSKLNVTLAPVNATTCNGGSITLTASGGTSYLWSTGSVYDTTVVSPITTTTYTVSVGNGGCSFDTSIVVIVNQAPPLTIEPLSPSICNGQSVNIKVPSSGSDYTWTPSTGLNTTTGDSVIANPTALTIYNVTGTDSLGCTVNATDTVKINTPPTLYIYPISPTVCSGSPTTLSVDTTGTNYTWTPALGLSTTTGNSTIILNPTITVTYSVTGTDSLGCSVSASDTIKVIAAPNKPTITIHFDTLISSATSDNQWNYEGAPINNATNPTFVVSGSTSGYSVTVTNEANGCTTTSDTTTTTGINQLSTISSQVSIYPNPFNNNVFIKINSSAVTVSEWSLQLIDVLGRTVYTNSSLNYNNDIDLSNLPSGVYFITVLNKTERAVFPVVKQN